MLLTVWPEPGSSAAGWRTMDVLEALGFAGAEISVASAAGPSPFAVDVSALGFATRTLPMNDAAFDRAVGEIQPDIVIFDRFRTEEQFGWRVERAVPGALRVIDSSDVHALREARRRAVEKGEKENLWNAVALREMAAFYRSDLTLVISRAEMEILTTRYGLPPALLAYWPLLVGEEAIGEGQTWTERQHFCLIGNFRHPPNRDAIAWTREVVWPHVRALWPEAEGHVYGAYAGTARPEWHDPANGFVMKGRTPSVEDCLGRYRVNLALLRYGAGLKGKVLDGLRTGTPTLVTTCAAEGIGAPADWTGQQADDPLALAQRAVRLATDETLWQKARERGWSLLRREFAREIWRPRLGQILARALAEKEDRRAGNPVGQMLRHHQHRSTEFMGRWIEAKNRGTQSGS